MPDAPATPAVGTIIDSVELVAVLPDRAVIVGDFQVLDPDEGTPEVWQKRGLLWASVDYVDEFTSEQLLSLPIMPKRYLLVWVPPTTAR